jgi:dsDNA-specific endonuclease/ATPase MutS2
MRLGPAPLTFRARVYARQALRREADGAALALLDEVGTGTDPGEGAALGAALLRALAADGAHRTAAFTLATTHHRRAHQAPRLVPAPLAQVRPRVSVHGK